MIDNIMYTLYIVLGIAPFSVIRMYPFYDKLRVKPKYFWCIFGAVLSLEVVWFIAIENNNFSLFVTDNEILRMFFYFVYFLISIIFIKDSPSKHLIVWAVCILFSWTFTAFTFWIDELFPLSIPFLMKNISMIVLLPVFLWLGFMFINKHIMPLINQSNVKTNRFITALLLLIIVMGLITAREFPYNATRPLNVLFVRIITSAITVIVCYIFSTIIKEQKEIQNMIEENKQKEKMLDVSTEQFIALSDKIEETRRARHDLKFHISAIKNFANKKDYASILEYLEVDNLLPNDNVLSFCNHPTLNILFSYYRDIAKSNHINFEVTANVSNEIFLNSSEIWVLLGNLLENAVEATTHIDENDRQIQVKMNANETSLALTVDNPFNETYLNRNGENFTSTKEKGGVGLNSVSFLAEKYNGLATFETKNNWFLSAVTMYSLN